MTAIAVHGAAGRMGRSVIELVLRRPGAQLVAALTAAAIRLGQDVAGLLAGAEPLGC